MSKRNRRKRNYDGAAPELSSSSVESPEGKWIARVQAGVLIVNQIEPTLVQGTAVRFQFSKDQCRDRATIFGPDLGNCPILLAFFSKVLVVCKLDRLSRSMIDLLTILKQIDEAGATFRSLGEAIETESAAGRMMMQMLGCFAQFEREIIVERINRGLAHARANGKIGGGRYKLSPEDQREAVRMIQVEQKSQGQVADRYKVDRSTTTKGRLALTACFLRRVGHL